MDGLSQVITGADLEQRAARVADPGVGKNMTLNLLGLLDILIAPQI